MSDTPDDADEPQQTGADVMWIAGRGWVHPTCKELCADDSPWHAHWSPVWRLDDEASRQLVTYCCDPVCEVDENRIGRLRPDNRFVCDYCGKTALLVTIEPTDGGKSAACPGHADQLEEAFMADAIDRDEKFEAEQRASRRRRRNTRPRTR